MAYTQRFREALHKTCRDDIAKLRATVALLEKRLRYDAQTGLYSKEAFFDHFESQACKGDYLIFLDLDNFKSVNDNYGHDVGDQLLVKIAVTVKDALKDYGYVARLAGDEYLIHIAARYADMIDAIIEDVRQAISKTNIELGDLKISRSASFGLTNVRAGMTPQNAIIEANHALSFAKKNGKNTMVKLSERGKNLPLQAPSLEEVRLGLQRKEIKYHVQPIFCLTAMEVIGFEALLRWHRRSGEVIGPAQFINTMTQAYDVQTEPPLEAAYQTAAWAVLQQKKFITFNISGAFLNKIAHQGLDWIDTILRDIPWDCVIFELVETIIDCDEDSIAHILVELRKRGIRIALDDFGTGQSTLERLQRTHVDLVKIDRSFLYAAIASERDANILQGMINIAAASGAETVVEGVETEGQLHMARMLGATYAQGFYLGEPVLPSEWKDAMLHKSET